MEHRNKHRVARTLYFIAIFVALAIIMGKMFRYYDPHMVLLLGFTVGLALFVFYELGVLKSMKKYKDMYVNSATQIYMGTIAMLSAIITLLFYLFFNIEIESGLFIMSILAMIFLLVTIKPFDQFLEKRGN